MAINVCDEIQCPYAKKNGCDRYSVSNHCHLTTPNGPGSRREGLEPNQYWLFAEEGAIDLTQLKSENKAWLAADETTQRRLELGRLGLFD